MKKLVLILACVGTFSLAACSSDPSTSGPDNTSTPDTSYQNDNSGFEVHHVPVDGKTVTCLYYDRGISCDWANTK